MHEIKSVEEKVQLDSATYHSQYVFTAQIGNHIRQQHSSQRGVGCLAYKSVLFKENNRASDVGLKITL